MKMFPVAILCGGLSTRLGDQTKKIPKSLVLINGKPFIYYQLELLKKNKFKDIILCLGHFGEQIVEYVCQNKFEMNIQYSFDGNKLLGTGGSLLNALHLLPDNFWVIYGDSYLQFDYALVQRQFEKSKAMALMTVYKNNNQYGKSNIIYKDNKIVNYSKSYIDTTADHIDFGALIFSNQAFNHFGGSFDLSEVYKKMLAYNQLSAFLMKTRFYEIGSIEGIKEFEKYIKEKD